MNKEQIISLFPEFQEIQNSNLRESAIRAMQTAMEAGGWSMENISACPVTMNWKDCDVSWVEHVADVTDICIMEFDKLEKFYSRHHVPFSRDVVITGALLHDIGKLTEFIYRDGKAVHGESFELVRHPLSGALLAAKAGLPDNIIHLIATHSFEGDKSYQTQESSFVRAIDMFVFKCSVQGLEKR
ncbi:HD domain-containing protein [Oscillibacter sp.]|uniref:HD domain-containing protein n=1 Tax=Oscillibacter sp. TaxID=1945593 RepID=UPI0028A6C308|nr:HD domain-containing protein [Oscillibacter sp.]